MTGADLIRQWLDACRSHVPRRPGPEALTADWADLGARIDAALAGAARQALGVAAEAVEAMPDFAGRAARPDGLTHRCAGCGEWMDEEGTTPAPSGAGRAHAVPEYDRHGEAVAVPCGPVHDLSPVEGVLRGEAAALLRGLDPATVLARLHGARESQYWGSDHALRYQCSACGLPAARPAAPIDRIDSGTILICRECGGETVVDLDTREDRTARYAAAARGTEDPEAAQGGAGPWEDQT